MSVETAQLILGGMTAIGLVVWLTSLRYFLQSQREVQRQRTPEDLTLDVPEGWIAGCADVEGDPATLSSRAASVLAAGNPLAFGALKIVDKDDRHLSFEHTHPGVANKPPGQWFRRGELTFQPIQSGKTRVEWIVEPVNFEWMLWLGGAFLVLGLAALVIGYWVVDTYLVHGGNVQARWQSFQMFQAGHFLWPPFLFGALYRRGVQSLRSNFEALAHNLPHHGK